MNALPVVILAAGSGRRMGAAGEHRPKTLTPLGATTIIDTILDAVVGAGLSRCVVVTGFRADMLHSHLAPRSSSLDISYVHNSDYAVTNNIYSLQLARDHLVKGFYLLEADVCFESRLLADFIALPQANAMVVDRFAPPMNGTVVRLRRDGIVERMLMPSKADTAFDYTDTFKTVNIYRFGEEYARDRLVPGLDTRILAGDLNSYYETVIKSDIDDGAVFQSFSAHGYKWWEIDTQEDLATAEKIFAVPPASA